MTIECPGPKWKQNDGLASPPRGMKGKAEDGSVIFKRVDVVLANGTMRENWPAGGGRPATRWTLIASPFDIAWYRVR